MLVRQVKLAFDMLEFFAQRRTAATLTEISDHFGWPRSSTFNLIETLSECGYLHEARTRAGYYPTRRLLSLATLISENDSLPEKLTNAVSALARSTGETAILGAVSGINAIYLDVAESNQSIRYFAKSGDLVPLYATAIGRALMACASEKELKTILSKTRYEKFADNTPTTEEGVRKRIEDVRKLTFSVNDNGYQPHLLGVAVPFESDGRHLALLIAGPSYRMHDRVEELAGTIDAFLLEHGFSNALADQRSDR